MSFLWTVARILVKNAANSLGFGLGDSAVEIWEAWHKETPSTEKKLAEVQEVAQLSPAEAGDLAKKIVLELASEQPDTLREQVATLLTLVPEATRRSLRRPEDPSGKSLRPSTAVDGPDSVRALLPTSLPRFKAGDTPPGVGDWELVEMLGVGGFGEVWKARNPFLDGVPPAALKFCTDKEAARTLRHEAGVLNQVMRQGTHPGIVRLLHSYLRADPPCLEYEYVEGGDLAGVIRDWHRGGAVSLDRVIQTVLQLAEIVGFAHRLDPPVVHRDLKPANVLVQRGPGGALQLKVADFGIGGIAAGQAIKELAQKPAWHMTAMATGTCTPLYASPQQAAGNPPDPRDDVFALGILWHQMLTGNLASGRPGGSGWKKRLLGQGVRADLVELLESCFEDEPAQRPRDTAELAERLKAVARVAPARSEDDNRPDSTTGSREVTGKPEQVEPAQQPARLRLVRNPSEISASLRTFNGQAKANAARAAKILRQTSYWVYDQGQDAFGPSKFVGYAGMDFGVYEKATNGEAVGDVFDGHASRTAITKALGNEFVENAELAARLVSWGDRALGRAGVFAGIDPKKWRFVTLGLATELALHPRNHTSAPNDEPEIPLVPEPVPPSPPRQEQASRNAGDLEAYYRGYRERHRARPKAVQAYRDGVDPALARSSYRTWLRFVDAMGDLSGRQKRLLDEVGGFLDVVETTPMTRSFKMLTLRAMLQIGALPGQVGIQTLVEEFARLARASDRLRSEVRVDLDDPNRLRAYLEQNPIAAWAGGRGTRGQVYFRYEEGVFSTAFAVPEEMRGDLSELVGELVEWRLAAYLGRQQE